VFILGIPAKLLDELSGLGLVSGFGNNMVRLAFVGGKSFILVASRFVF